MNVRVDGLLPPKATETATARRPRDGDAFERTLDALEGRWYACEATVGAERGAAPPAGAAGSPLVASAAEPAAAQAAAPVASTPRATPAQQPKAAGAAAPGAPPAARLAVGPSPAVQAAFDDALASGAMPTATAASRAALPSSLRVGTRGEAEATHAPAVVTQSTTLVAPSIPPRGAANGIGGEEPAAVAEAAHRARPSVPVPDASRAAPAALVMTVMQAHDGRRTLAVRCPPVLRATALALARQWLGEQDALRPAALIVNGETVSPLSGRN